jgi:hypothetical protein
MRDKNLGKRRLVTEYADDARFLQPHDHAFGHRRDRRHAPRLSGQAAFAAELVHSENYDDRFFASVGHDGDLDLAFLDVEYRIRWIAL